MYVYYRVNMFCSTERWSTKHNATYPVCRAVFPQRTMKFQDRLDIAIARGYIHKEQDIIVIPNNTNASCLFPSFRAITKTSLHRAMRRAGYMRATRGTNSWKRRKDCVKIVHCHQ